MKTELSRELGYIKAGSKQPAIAKSFQFNPSGNCSRVWFFFVSFLVHFDLTEVFHQ